MKPCGAKTMGRYPHYALPVVLRVVTWILVPTQLMATLPPIVLAGTPPATPQFSEMDTTTFNPPLVRTPTNIVKEAPPKLAPVSFTPVFSASPTDEEIIQSRVLPQRMFPMGGHTTPEENQVLAHAFLIYSQGPRGEDVSIFVGFLDKYPYSPWRAALLTNLGILYQRTGQFTKALIAWEEAWQLSKYETDTGARAVADRALAELAQINAWVGRYERLETLLEEAMDRPMAGPVADKLVSSREGLWMMRNRPDVSFKCGPYALDRIQRHGQPQQSMDIKIRDAASHTNGMSLVEVCGLANELGMNFQMAKREPGAPILVPSVVNWKLGHYGAVVKERNGRYLIEDSTFALSYGRQMWISGKALDEETSGYFLVPVGSLPEGWRPVSEKEGNTVWGRGWTTSSDEDDYGDDVPCVDGTVGGDMAVDADCSTCGMARYTVYAMLVSLHIADTPLRYKPPRGPALRFTVSYNQRDAAQDPDPTYGNLGNNWTFNWLSYITIPEDGPARVYIPGGGARTYAAAGEEGGGAMAPPNPREGSYLVTNSFSNYIINKADGSKRVYMQENQDNKRFLTYVIDPQGNTNSIVYDTTNAILRVRGLVDSLGRTNWVYYETNDVSKITRVTDTFGRSATFIYENTSTNATPNYRLIKITDMIGISSQFTYDTNTPSLINTLTTPYGTTIFAGGSTGGIQRWLEMTDPLGQKERVEFRHSAPGMSDPEPAGVVPAGVSVDNGHMDSMTTFHWDRKQYQEASRTDGTFDYTKAVARKFMRSELDWFVTSGVLHSQKAPLENRVWFRYPGQDSPASIEGVSITKPSAIARVMDDGTTQLYSNEYDNAFGKLTKKIDPLGRVTSYIYSTNGIDLLEVRQSIGTTNSNLLAKYVYDSNHQVITNIDAAGQATKFAYDQSGQILTNTNAKGEKTIMVYSNSFVAAVIGPTGVTNTMYTYDLFGRVRTFTDSEGYTVTTDYDDFDRPTVITYPDDTYQQIVYDKLDAVATRDRTGRWTHKLYDPLRRLAAVRDPMGRITQFQYCPCGSLENLVDPKGQTTSWAYDVQGRVTQKFYSDSTSVRYTYENTTSRLKKMTDAMAQETHYEYLMDNALKQISYSNAVVATPSVSYLYDTNYNRIAKMIDGTGTTTYSYKNTTNTVLGAGRLASIDGPLADDTISYNYDQLGRVSSRAIVSGMNNVSIMSYDSLGRMATNINALGTFTYSYVGVTPRLSKMTYPKGQITTNTYYDSLGDHRLKQIWNKAKDGSTLSKFDYMYDAEGEIQTWVRQTGSSSNKYDFAYDDASQLLDAISSGSAGTNIYGYVYDLAGNRTSERVNAKLTGASHNNVNQLTSQTGAGPMRFRGNVDEPVTNLTVAGNTAKVDTNRNFTGYAQVSPGVNTVPIIAKDYGDNIRTNNYQITVAGGVPQSFTYDLNGNLSVISNQYSVISNVWDAANRLVAIVSNGTYRSEFTYDGLSRRVRQMEISGGTTNSNKRFVWCGTQLCEERDSGGQNVTKMYFSQGEYRGGQKIFYSRDHLGSVREVTTPDSSVVRTRYDYDPWGRRVNVNGGDVEADFGFTGHYFHAPSGLHLALYRAYSADLGRWLSRDPIGDADAAMLSLPDELQFPESDPVDIVDASLNAYMYVGNKPMNSSDLFGLAEIKKDIDKECLKKCLKEKKPSLWTAGGIAIGGTVIGVGYFPGGWKVIVPAASICSAMWIVADVFEDCIKKCKKTST